MHSARLAAARHSENAPMPRRDFPKQMLRNGVLVDRFYLLEHEASGDAFIFAAEKFAAANNARMRVNRAAREAEFNGHGCSQWNRALLRDGEAVAVQIPGKAAADHVASNVRVIAEEHRNIQVARETIHRAEFFVAGGAPDDRHEEKDVEDGPHDVDYDSPEVITVGRDVSESPEAESYGDKHTHKQGALQPNFRPSGRSVARFRRHFEGHFLSEQSGDSGHQHWHFNQVEFFAEPESSEAALQRCRGDNVQ